MYIKLFLICVYVLHDLLTVDGVGGAGMSSVPDSSGMDVCKRTPADEKVMDMTINALFVDGVFESEEGFEKDDEKDPRSIDGIIAIKCDLKDQEVFVTLTKEDGSVVCDTHKTTFADFVKDYDSIIKPTNCFVNPPIIPHMTLDRGPQTLSGLMAWPRYLPPGIEAGLYAFNVKLVSHTDEKCSGELIFKLDIFEK